MQKINFLTAKLINNNYIKPNEKRLLSYANNKFYKNLQQNKITNIGKKTINTAIITTGLNITENIITSLYSYKNTQMGYYTPINSNEIKNLAQISERIKTANSREEYTTILAEIKSLPENKNKEILQKQAFDKYNSWLKKQDQEFDIRMEYTPKNKKNKKYELTNEEFENLKEKLKDKVPNDLTLNKSNILIADKILNDEKLHEEFKTSKYFKDIISKTKSIEEAKIKIRIIDKLNNLNKKPFDGKIGETIFNINNLDKLQLAIKILSIKNFYYDEDCIIDFPKFFNNKKTKKDYIIEKAILDTVNSTNDFFATAYNIETLAFILARKNITKPEESVLNKIYSDKNIYKNKNVIANLDNIINYTETLEDANFVNNIISNEKLRNNEVLLLNLWDIIPNMSKEGPRTLINKILSDERLYNNKSVFDLNLWNKIKLNRYDKKVVQKQINLIDKILSDEKLYNNPNIINNIGPLVMFYQAPLRIKLINTIITNEAFLQNNKFMNNITNILYWIENFRLNLKEIILNEKNYNNDLFMSNVDDICPVVNKKNIEFLKNILSNEKYCNNKLLMDNVHHFLKGFTSSKKTQSMLYYIDKIFFDEKYYKNENIINNLNQFFHYRYTANANRMLNIILENSALYNNKNLMKNLYSILMNIDSKDNFNFMLRIFSNKKINNNKKIIEFSNIIALKNAVTANALLDTILNNKKYFDNKKIMNNLAYILNNVNNDKNSIQLRINLVDKIFFDEKFSSDNRIIKNLKFIFSSTEADNILNTILSDKKLYTNENVMNNIEKFLYNTQKEEQKSFILRILTDKMLYDNKNIMSNLYDSLNRLDPKNLQQRIDLINNLTFNENLYNNENIIKNFDKFVLLAETKNSIELTNMILSDKLLYDNKKLMDNLDDIIGYNQTEKNIFSKIMLLKVIYELNSNNNDLLNIIINNENFIEKLPDIILNTNTEEQCVAKLYMLTLFIKNSFLYENISVINNLGNIINSINSEKDFLFKQNLLKKYLFDDGLIDNEDVMNNLGKLLS